MFESSMLKGLMILFLVGTISGACLLSSELDGLCTGCASPQNLLSGFCVTPIPGCINQLSSNLCQSCETGYTYSNHKCLPPSGGSGGMGLQQYLETYADRGPNHKYQLLDFHFRGKYQTELTGKISNISMVYQLKTTYGFIFALTYMNPYSNGGTIYRAEALVDYFFKVTEYRFVSIVSTELNNYSALLWLLEREVVVNSIPTLNDIKLNQIQQLSSNDYRLFYINFNGQIYVKDVQRQLNSSSGNYYFATVTQISYAINEYTVINYVFSLFPKFQLHVGYSVNDYTVMEAGVEHHYYKFIFDSQIIVIVQVKALQLALYSYQEPDNIVDLGTTALGGYYPLPNLADTLYLQVKQYVQSLFPILNTKTVQSVRYQVVQGTNFMIEFTNFPFSHDSYTVIAHQPLGSGNPQLTSIHKNGVNVQNSIVSSSTSIPGAFNYEADTDFKGLYQFFRTSVEPLISSLLPIMSVQYVLLAGSAIDYMVVYTPTEYAYLRYTPQETINYQITSYTSMGTSIPLTGSTSAPVPQTRESLLAFLKTAKPSLFTSDSILMRYSAELDLSQNGYQMDMLTQFGVYFTRVHKKGFLYLSTITQISFNTCADLDSSQFSNNDVISSLNTFILQNYWQVNGYSLVLVQGYISSVGEVSYRMLYSKGGDRYDVRVVREYGLFMINSLTYHPGGACGSESIWLNSQCLKLCTAFVS